jgi:RND family efflux transporter MFP subunit
MVSITTKFSGWVEKVHVNYVGEMVTAGQPLFEIYSPELVQTEQELLSALDYARRIGSAPEDVRGRAEGLVDAARTRLSYWDITPEQVQRLEQEGKVVRTLTVTAPTSGVVMMRMPGLEGMSVRPGMELFHIADVKSLLLKVEVFEGQLAFVDVGSRADVSLSYFPGKEFVGAVRFIEPEVSEKTRSIALLLEVPNSNGKLKAGMFATVVFEPVISRGAVTVPRLAVIRTGERDVVILQTEPGRFVPRAVRVGHEGLISTEILEGVEEGDLIVTSAQFLIDSESSLQAAIQKMIASRGREASGGSGDAQ